MKFHEDTGMFESDEKFFNRAGLLIFGQVASDPRSKRVKYSGRVSMQSWGKEILK